MDAGQVEEVIALLMGPLRGVDGADTVAVRFVAVEQGCHCTAVVLRGKNQILHTDTSGRVADAADAGSDAVDTAHTVANHDAALAHRCAYSVATVHSVLVIVVLGSAIEAHIAFVAARRDEEDDHIRPDQILHPTSDAEPHLPARSEVHRSAAAMASVSAPAIRAGLGRTSSCADED